MSLQDCPVTIPTAGLWGPVLSAEPVPVAVVPVVLDNVLGPHSSSASDSMAVDFSQHHVCPQHLGPEQLQQMITSAIQQSLAASLGPLGRDSSVRSFMSVSPERDYQEESFSAGDPGSPTLSLDSHPSILVAGESREPELSEDEGLPPEQPAFTGFFPLALFKSLLFKAVNTAQHGSNPAESQAGLNPVFAEPTRPVDSTPVPPLFLDVVRKQWSSPGSALVPSSTDHKYFNVAPDLATLLQVPSVDAPVAALLPNASIPGDPEEGLRREEHRSDQVLQRAHQGSAWAIHHSTVIFTICQM